MEEPVASGTFDSRPDATRDVFLRHALCESCGHALAGLAYTPGEAVLCPECGREHRFQRAANRSWPKIPRLIGWIAACVGVVLVVLALSALFR
ncbi:MAG: hypothetical protein CMJ31_05510 [Phycisphaerae bacterium]|nr:hypothetical protein [Phycisphaerae bacterium]